MFIKPKFSVKATCGLELIFRAGRPNKRSYFALSWRAHPLCTWQKLVCHKKGTSSLQFFSQVLQISLVSFFWRVKWWRLPICLSGNWLKSKTSPLRIPCLWNAEKKDCVELKWACCFFRPLRGPHFTETQVLMFSAVQGTDSLVGITRFFERDGIFPAFLAILA